MTLGLFHDPISLISASVGTSHDPFPWEIWLKSKAKTKHFSWIKTVFLQLLWMQQSGFYWKLSTLQKSLYGQATSRSGSAPLQQRQSILCHVQTSGCSIWLPSSSPKSMLPSPEGVPASSLVHAPQSVVWAVLQPRLVLEQLTGPDRNEWLSGVGLGLQRIDIQRQFIPQLHEPSLWCQARGRKVSADMRDRIGP